MNEIEFKKLQQRHTDAAERLSEAKGAVRSLKERLVSEFQLKSVEEARTHLKVLRDQRGKYQKDLDRFLRSYQEEFPNE